MQSANKVWTTPYSLKLQSFRTKEDEHQTAEAVWHISVEIIEVEITRYPLHSSIGFLFLFTSRQDQQTGCNCQNWPLLRSKFSTFFFSLVRLIHQQQQSLCFHSITCNFMYSKNSTQIHPIAIKWEKIGHGKVHRKTTTIIVLLSGISVYIFCFVQKRIIKSNYVKCVKNVQR